MEIQMLITLEEVLKIILTASPLERVVVQTTLEGVLRIVLIANLLEQTVVIIRVESQLQVVIVLQDLKAIVDQVPLALQVLRADLVLQVLVDQALVVVLDEEEINHHIIITY